MQSLPSSARLNLVYTHILMKSTGKGIKRTKGQPVYYEELKNRRNIMLTNTAWENLVTTSDSLEISVSELIERLARNLNIHVLEDDCD